MHDLGHDFNRVFNFIKTPLIRYNNFKNSFTTRYQLILRNVGNFSEATSYPFSYATLMLLIFGWFLGTFSCGLYLAKTALAKWMSPAYIQVENKKKIVSLAASIDDLEKHIACQATFIETLQKVIQENAPGTPRTQQNHDLSASPNPPAKDAQKTHKPYLTPDHQIHSSNTHHQGISDHMLFPPLQGMVIEPFNRTTGHYGIDIVAKDKAPIKAIGSGIVILADWSVQTGWCIVIQHANNLVSISKHCSVLFKKVGNLVRLGDLIALMGNSGELSTGPHLHFELWGGGLPLNPEDFINF